MLSGFSLEVAMLAIWKFMIVVAVCAFVLMLALKVWKPIKRLFRKMFGSSSRRKSSRTAFDNSSTFAHSRLEDQKLSEI